MKKAMSMVLVLVMLMMCCACQVQLTGEEPAADTAAGDTYPFTATLDDYPDVMISAKSLEALNEVVEALAVDADVTTTTTAADTTVADVSTTTASAATTTAATTTTTAAEESGTLNPTEQALFEAITQALFRFTDPASVKVVKFYAYQEVGDRYFVSLKSITDKGGYETKLYTLDNGDVTTSTFSEFQLKNNAAVLGLTTPDCNIGKVNRALDDYYASQGW